MFGLGMPEILIILALALIIIGPTKLPDLAKTLGKSMREFKGAAQDFKNSIDIETSITDLDSSSDEIKKNFDNANKELGKKKPTDKTDNDDEDSKTNASSTKDDSQEDVNK